MTDETSEPIEEPGAADGNNAPETEQSAAPTLNRAERRAQAKGKKSAPGGTGPAGLHPGNRLSGGQPAFIPTKSRIPRTGHK